MLALGAGRPRALRAAEESETPAVLRPIEWKTLAAIAQRILPSGEDGPGALEANCVNFIDKALANEDVALLPGYRSGLAEIRRLSRQRFGKSFHRLDAALQDEILVSLETGFVEDWREAAVRPGELFETIRLHTIYGALAAPEYGGNRDYAGWRLVGYPGPRRRDNGFTTTEVAGDTPIAPAWGGSVELAKP